VNFRDDQAIRLLPPGDGESSLAGGRGGLLEKLMAAVRPEFRADDLAFDPRDPVFGGPACRVSGCLRPARARGLCWGHHQRWAGAGKPDLDAFAASTNPGWFGHGPLLSCDVADCRYGRARRGLCARHVQQWDLAGQPEPGAWRTGPLPLPPPSPPPASCGITYCSLWAQGKGAFCRTHGRQWKTLGCPDPGEFASQREQDGPAGNEHIDLRPLPAQLKLEMQYALQCRRDEGQAKIVPGTVRRIVCALAGTGVTSLLDWPEESWQRFPPARRSCDGWPALLLCARRQIENLKYGRGWEVEYPRGTWRLRNLGFDDGPAHLRFDRIPQPWLKELAKRWVRWRLGTGLSAGWAYRCVDSITRFARFLASPAEGIDVLAHVDRAVLERYLADLRAQLAGTKAHRTHVGVLSSFFQAIRQHGWDDTLPAGTLFFTEDYPKEGDRLPRALAEHVMAQVEHPGNLDRWDDPARRLITLILMRCGLRISDAVKLPCDCIAHDAERAPYLRYYNHKMKREALVPIDEELQQLITEQQHQVLSRWPGGVPVLFPRPSANLDGTRPFRACTYREALYRWLENCDIRDEHGRPAHFTPHQWRHTLGTRLINKDVPQEVIRKILDHDSHAMTAHYARLNDTTVRRHWEAARKVNIQGETVTLDPDGPLADAAWAKQRLSRTTQALPNGFCGLPLVQTCPHANSCLTCPLFVTTAEFLPQHRAHRQQALRIITTAEARGQTRMAEMNRQVADSLEKIITTLESDDPQQPEAAADAS
jgi:integrase